MKTATLLSRTSRALALRRSVTTNSTSSSKRIITTPYVHWTLTSRFTAITPSLSSRAFSTSPYQHKGLQPDSEDPSPPDTEAHDIASTANATPSKISDNEYHELADQYLNSLVLAIEEKVESTEAKGTEVEYSAGVLTITTPRGTYVLNKQPPNKQIWLSSPLSGPKRFDWVAGGSGQHEKQDSELEAGDLGTDGKWVYLRDGSNLSDIIRKEISVEVSRADDVGEAIVGNGSGTAAVGVGGGQDVKGAV